MHILITGGAGFIGRTLCETLIRKNIQITIIDKKPTFLNKNAIVNYIQANVCNKDKIQSIFDTYQFDGIVHLAAVSRVVEAEMNKPECRKTNVEGIQVVLNAIEQSQQNPWLIFGSSREVYGEQSQLPVKENDLKQAVNVYGETKIKGETLFFDFAKQHDLSCAIVRFSNVYGNRYDIFDRVIPRFIRAIVENSTLTIEGGDQLIDFTHIDDTVASLVKIIFYLDKHDNIQDAFHLCPGIGWSLQQLIQYIENATGQEAQIKVNPKRNYDVVKFVGDMNYSRNKLGLKEFIDLEVGIQRSIDEYCYDLQGCVE
ncbi:NAD(P)-dependent oxidoreductase [Candidatus Albibeggiatoa sp. nov. BB20]|uniref:NAD-dependent epimerase/dehydratase family protein n=1 Tax=Candidatus Albibeggiatoa sp. nov. BB20 TaxID=3162723 RepID=UPI0033659D6A